jgi:uncharacterized lipoprotein YajG
MTSNLSLLAIIILLLSGCTAPARSIIDISLPYSTQPSNPNEKEVYINSLVDDRSFEAQPTDLSTPSLNPNAEQGNNINARAIARKSGSDGKGLGDILLPEGKSVELLVTNVLKQALIANGYKIISDKELITDKTSIVDAKIDKFWAWMNQGLLASSITSQISTNVVIKNSNNTEKRTTSVKQSDTFQSTSDNNWKEIIEKVLNVYAVKLSSQLKL